MTWQFSVGGLGIAIAVMSSPMLAGPLAVPNASFESPATGFVSLNLDSWQKSPKPEWYIESGGFLWTQLTGLFKNTAPGSPDHIDNCDGAQAVWLFAVPEVALSQDYETVDWDDVVASHALDVRFEPGKSYELTVGVIGSGGGMQQGATLELSLYFRDAASNEVAVAATTVTNTTEIFTDNTHFVDFTVSVPMVTASDPWAGQHLGIQMRSTVATNLQGGYWDLDNVRLSAIEEPTLLNPRSTNGQFQFTIKSEPGLTIEILSASELALPIASWARAAMITNTVGTMTYSDQANNAARYFQAQRLPQ